MSNSIHRRVRNKFSGLWLASAVLVTLSAPALAALGGNASSVATDASSMKASAQMKVVPGALYTTHEIQSPNSTVREFVSPDGRVFGVAWQGPFIPSMRQ